MFLGSTAVVLLIALSAAVAQEFSFGRCPKVNTTANFDLQKYLGTWYEVYKFHAGFESGQTCVSANYSTKADGHINVDNRGYKDGKQIQAIGDAYIPDSRFGSKLLVRFSDLAPYGDYWVLDTDYKTHTMIYSCGNILGISHIEFAWILSRQRTLDQGIVDRLFNIMKEYKIDTRKFSKTDQSNCP